MNKKIISILLILMALFSLTPFTYAVETALLSYNITLHSDSKGTLMVGRKDKNLYSRYCNYNSQVTEKIYNFSLNVQAYGVYKNKIYVIYPSDKQQYIYYLAVIKNNEVKDLFHFYSKNLSSDCKLTVGSDGYYYIFNRKNIIEIYNKQGENINVTERFHNMLTVKNQCYGIQYDKVCRITASGVTNTYEIDNSSTVINVSDNYITNSEGSVYQLTTNSLKQVMNIEVDSMKNPCETDKYIVSVKDNCLLAYDKNTGKLEHKYQLQSDVYNISGYKNKITVVYKDFSVKFYDAEEIFKETENNIVATKSNEKNDSSSSSKVSFDKYIIVEQGTTASAFKKQYENCTIEFADNISGQLGTNTAVTIDNSKHIFVIKGDLTGEGNINSRDISAMFDELLNIEKLSGAFIKAGDLNDDNKITNADLVLLSKIVQ